MAPHSRQTKRAAPASAKRRPHRIDVVFPGGRAYVPIGEDIPEWARAENLRGLAYTFAHRWKIFDPRIRKILEDRAESATCTWDEAKVQVLMAQLCDLDPLPSRTDDFRRAVICRAEQHLLAEARGTMSVEGEQPVGVGEFALNGGYLARQFDPDSREDQLLFWDEQGLDLLTPHLVRLTRAERAFAEAVLEQPYLRSYSELDAELRRRPGYSKVMMHRVLGRLAG